MTDPTLEPDDPLLASLSRQAGVPLAVLTAINSLNLGILVVDRECRITFANDYARDLLRSLRGKGSASPRAEDRIHSASPFDKQLRKAISDGHHQTESLLSLNGAGNNSLVVRIVPYGSDDPGHAGASGSILFVSDAGIRPNLDFGPTAKLYGLTPAELRLLEALLRGERMGGYAKKCSVTRNTVKWHLAQLFRKTQTRCQSELLLCVLANPVFRLASPHSALRPTSQGSGL